MHRIFAECSLRKQAWRNPNYKEGKVGCLHQNIFTRKVTDIAFTSDFFNNHCCPCVPCIPVFEVPPSPFHTSPRPILDVLKSLVSRPLVPSPHTSVPTSPSPCPHPSFMHSPFKVQLKTYLFMKAFNLQFNILITIIISFHLLYIYLFSCTYCKAL